MTAQIVTGKRYWQMDQDDDGHRTYELSHLVEVESGVSGDGPFQAANCAGLPLPGTTWAFGTDNDPWAYCTLRKSVTPFKVSDGEPNQFFEVKQWYTTRPLSASAQRGIGAGSAPGAGSGSDGYPSGGGGGGQPGAGRCNTARIEDPLLEAPKISGGSKTFTEEATEALHNMIFDSSGNLIRTTNKIVNSAFEQLRGPQVEFDAHRSTIHAEQNWPVLEWALCNSMVDTLNNATFWGFPTRFIKLSTFNWELMLYGLCYFYFKRVFDFEVYTRVSPIDTTKIISGWDRILTDEGTKVIRGYWNYDEDSPTFGLYVPVTGIDKSKPSNYIRFKDWNGENARVILDGRGEPITTASEAGKIKINKYTTSNFLLLGLPT